MMTKMLPTVSKQYIAQTRFVFHCHIKIKVPLDYGENILDECFELLEDIDRRFNSYQQGSYFDQINQKAGTWVTVDDECIRILETVLLVSDLTKGNFDVTCMPLLRLWGFYRHTNQDIPTPDAIQDCLKKVDYRTISIKDNNVKIQPGQEIVTGSFIKAFATDKVTELLWERGITDAIINAGGSTIMALNDDMHSSWKINVPDPFQSDKFSERITIANQCFSLSGRSNNNLVINGKTYGHILNPTNGLPVPTIQVGVVTKSAFIGDVLSTAIFALDKNEVENTINVLGNYFDFEYFRIEENNKNG